MSVVVCFALKEEAAPFQKIAAGKSGVVILLTGIGRQNAEKSVRGFLATRSPALVFTSGFAGGLNPDLKPGDVVFETSDENLRAKLLAAGAKSAGFFCADRVATTAGEKQQLRAESGADAVEMESAAVHGVCRERGILCVTVRAISDTAGEDLPLDFNALARPDKNLHYGKLARAIARSPGKIGALMELKKKSTLAAERLAVVLNKVAFSQLVTGPDSGSVPRRAG
jgi:adenosylhomocysteine nucleosidase